MKNFCKKRKGCSKIGPLSDAATSGQMEICKIKGDRKQCARMASMGLRCGEKIDLICPTNGSSCIFKVNGGTLSLDSDSIKTIFVKPI